MVTVSAVAAALLPGTAVSTWQAIRATHAEAATLVAAHAERKAKDDALVAALSERAAKNDALARETETKAVLGFLENRVFAAARPENVAGGLGHDVTLRKAIESALPYVNPGFANQPLIEARLRLTLGQSFLSARRSAAGGRARAKRPVRSTLGTSDPTIPIRSEAWRASPAATRALGRLDDALKLRRANACAAKGQAWPFPR